jgi:hypothetical protein
LTYQWDIKKNVERDWNWVRKTGQRGECGEKRERTTKGTPNLTYHHAWPLSSVPMVSERILGRKCNLDNTDYGLRAVGGGESGIRGCYSQRLTHRAKVRLASLLVSNELVFARKVDITTLEVMPSLKD